MDLSTAIFMFAVKQYQRRKDNKLNVAWLINLFSKEVDYCMDCWVAWKLHDKK